jgi:DNA polymerase IV (DinB-like DNA polymerase)
LPRVIFHVDLDAFYASVEERENPAYKGTPLIIGADPKKGKGRGVVVACSYEARKRGIRSGLPISRAYRLCPEGVYVRPNLALYGEVSNDVMEFLRKFAGKFEQVSIDEAYLDVSENYVRYGSPIELAKQIKSQLKGTLGLTCSIGIAPNKSAAKIASDFQKPDGLTYIDPEHVKEFLAPLLVSKISGIGSKTERKLNELGIKTIGQLASFPPKELHKQFGKPAIWAWAIANGMERVEVQDTFIMKSIGAEHTFEVDTDDWTIVDRELLALVDSVHARTMEEGKVFRTISLKIRFTGFETYTREKTMKFSTSKKELMIEAILNLSNEFRKHPKKIRLVGVRVTGLEDRAQKKTEAQTLEAFTGPSRSTSS